MRSGRSTALAAIFAIGALPVVLPAALPAPAWAQAPSRAAPTKAQLDSAAYTLRIVMTALQSNEVEQPVKNALFDCLYSNSIGEISAQADKVIAANAGKVDRKDASQMLAVVAGTCGYRPPATKPAAKSAPKR
ncbi:hypothetical protein [Sphingobium sp. YR768]|uniref:hypothetical protein n=1 Tax=Sphingobium sp. YR768 TaxID=1884365 RepID=UPI0008BEF26F|nr:hypothetical protein [Sphingobium sp. YR768]SEQ71461.1 hypothetical protein SAMN05518866_102233 [Sphingobium sp. YR768]